MDRMVQDSSVGFWRMVPCVVLLFIAAACSESSNIGGVVPYKYKPADVPQEQSYDRPPRTPDTPPCSEAARASLDDSDAEGDAFKVDLTIDEGTCYQDHGPRIEFTGEGAPELRLPRNMRVGKETILFPGAQLSLSVFNFDDCSQQAPDDPPFEVNVTFDDGSSLPAGTAPDDGCPEGGATLLEVGGWVLYDPAPPPARFEDIVITAEDVPKTVRGHEIPFIVRLQNGGDEAVSLDPCPVYRTAWGESGLSLDAVSYLNCDGAPDQIPPGGTVRFDMTIPLYGPPLKEEWGTLIFQLYAEDGRSADLRSHHEVTVYFDGDEE